MRAYLKRRFKRIYNRLLHENLAVALNKVRSDPFPWDMAAVQLHELGDLVRRIGYPQYLYGLLSAARTARAVDCPRFTAIEFGVAGGNGLTAIEAFAAAVEERFEVSIDVVGFDMSVGMPPRTDPRDCPFAFVGGEFAMDEQALRSRLTRASLRLGDVNETVSAYMKADFAPIGFASNDLDLYTSTRDSLKLFSLTPDRYLPRVAMYFDDLDGYPYSTVTGEWAAITKFNAGSENRQIGHVHGLKYGLGSQYRFSSWPDSMFVLHVFDHERYNEREETEMPSLALRERRVRT